MTVVTTLSRYIARVFSFFVLAMLAALTGVVSLFDFIELLARLRALIRRGVRPPLPDRLRAGRLTLDTRSREVTNAGEKVALTTREYALLEYFARHPNEVLGRAEIAEHVWDESYDAFSNVIDVYVQRLRRKLDVDDRSSVIATRRGQGYIFMPGEC